MFLPWSRQIQPVSGIKVALCGGTRGLLRRLVFVILPNCKSAVFTIAIFSFSWSWDDFLNQLIYLNTTEKFTVALALRMFNDNAAATNWGQLFAMSILSIVPIALIYAFAQKYFVEGIDTTGVPRGNNASPEPVSFEIGVTAIRRRRIAGDAPIELPSGN